MHRQLTREDRLKLEGLLSSGCTQKVCAHVLGIAPSTVSREIARCGRRKQYDALRAHRQASQRRRDAKMHTRRIEKDIPLRRYIIKKLKIFWSPEQIAETWKETLSHQTIYYWMKRNPSYRQYLRHKGRKRRNYGMSGIPSRFAAAKRAITERSLIVETRNRVGDWEGDTIVSKCKKQRILTHVDRMSMYLFADKLNVVTADDVVLKTEHRMKDIPCHTITYDNGSEFALHRMIEEKTKSLVYFAKPGRPDQRGSNENANMLLRQFFPKGSSFVKVTQKDVDRAVHLLNHRPRKSLGFLTPHQVFHGSIAFQAGG